MFSKNTFTTWQNYSPSVFHSMYHHLRTIVGVHGGTCRAPYSLWKVSYISHFDITDKYFLSIGSCDLTLFTWSLAFIIRIISITSILYAPNILNFYRGIFCILCIFSELKFTARSLIFVSSAEVWSMHLICLFVWNIHPFNFKV